MFLFKRFQDLFSKEYWQKAKFHKLAHSIGFFVFWMFIVSVVASFLTVFAVNRLANETLDDFRRDFVDFEISMTDGVLATRNLPDPFVLSEFLDDDEPRSIFGFDERVVGEFKRGFKQGLSEDLEINGQKFDADDLEFVLDTQGELGISAEVIDPTKLGFYFLSNEVIFTDPSAVNEDERLVVESYEETEDFRFDKQYVVEIWNDVSGKLSFVLFGLSFSIYVFLLIIVRFVTAFFWAGVIWAVASVMNFKFDYFEAYGVALTYLVPIAIVEILLVFAFTWIPFTTFGLVVLMSTLHGVGVTSKLEKVDKPEVLEEK